MQFLVRTLRRKCSTQVVPSHNDCQKKNCGGQVLLELLPTLILDHISGMLARLRQRKHLEEPGRLTEPIQLPDGRQSGSNTVTSGLPVIGPQTRPELSREGFGRRIIVPIMPILKRDGARWGSPDTFAALHLRERAE
jgi:hypothetical protein